MQATAFYLTITSPIYDNRDCIRGTRTTRIDEVGTYETEAMAFKKADQLRDLWCLDLGDGDHISVRRCVDGKHVVRDLPPLDMSIDFDDF
jgi:hypothetical protein